jgi:DNA-binding response OmpR family regulator
VSTAELGASLASACVASHDSVRELVHRLRGKLASLGVAEILDTLRGAGYRLLGDVTLAA